MSLFWSVRTIFEDVPGCITYSLLWLSELLVSSEEDALSAALVGRSPFASTVFAIGEADVSVPNVF